MTLIFFKWWYWEQFSNVIEYLKRYFIFLYDLFSVEICFKTLFSVWKRDQINSEGLPIKERLEIFALNLVSRFVGMVVKLATAIAYLITSIAFIVLAAIFIISWLAFPALILFLLYLGFANL